MKRFWTAGDLREHPCGMYVLHDDVRAEIESLRQQLATMTAAYVDAGNQHGKTLDELRECEKLLKYERMNTEVWRRDAEGKLEDRTAALHKLAECERERDEYACMSFASALITRTKERDMLVEALEMVCKIECVDDLWKAQEVLAKVGASSMATTTEKGT